MPTSASLINPTSFELSPCRVKFKGVDVGATLGNVKVSLKNAKSELKADQLGSTPIDRRISGHEFTIETELAEIYNKDLWKVIFPNFKEVGTINKLIYADSQLGFSDLSVAGLLNLHPLSKSDGDLSGDYNFYLCTSKAESEIVFSPTEQQKAKIIWTAYPDFTSTPPRFFTFGDPSIAVVNASAGSPVFTGTGNGVLSAVTVYNGFTKTETITIKCIAAPSAHNATFLMTGSVSGTLTSGALSGGSGGSVNLVSNELTCTITDGSTDFAVNDQWTIATVSANYA